MQVIRHPELANDISEVAMHYAEISERVLSAFWQELDSVLVSVNRHSCRLYFRASNQAPTGRHAIAQSTALILIHILGERLAGMRDVPASRSAGILPSLANEERKVETLAAILSHPIGRWARRPPSLTRRLRGISESKPSQTDMCIRTRALPWAVILCPVGAEDAGAIHLHSDSVMTRNARKVETVAPGKIQAEFGFSPANALKTQGPWAVDASRFLHVHPLLRAGGFEHGIADVLGAEGVAEIRVALFRAGVVERFEKLR